MRRPLRCLTLVTLLLAAPAGARADDYSDFRVPDHRLVDWNLALRGNLTTGRFVSANGPDDQRSNGYYSFTSPLRADDISERRERTAFVYLQDSPNMFTVESSGGFLSPGSSVEFQGITRFHSGQANWFEARYPGAGALSWNWGGTLYASMYDRDDAIVQHSGSATTFSEYSSQDRRTEYLYNASASLGSGRGRVRDVSGVYEAQVLEARLLETGRLVRPLSPDERQRLAEVFYLSGGIASVHDRPLKFLWTEIERVLARDGALRDSSLDTWSALRAIEPVMLLTGSNRRAGRFVGLFGFVSADRGHVDTNQRFESSSTVDGVLTSWSASETSDREQVERDDAGVGLEWSEHHPLSMRTQLDWDSRLAWGSHQTLSARILAVARHVIADHWDARATGIYDVAAWSSGGERSEPRWSLTGVGAVAYLLEDSWSLEAGYQVTQSQYRARDLPPESSFYHYLTLGVTYRVAGRLNAPIAGLASRPMLGGR